MYARLLCGNREIFVLPSVVVPRAASGSPDAVADDARDEEVTLVDSTCEAGEQSGAICGGVGGGRRRDQEECGIAKHGPNAGSGGRVTGARPHTSSCKQEQEGEADSAPASRQRRRSAMGLLQLEEAGCTGRRRPDMGGLRGRP